MDLPTNWTTQQRYQRIEQLDPNLIAAMKAARQQDADFPSYHIAPKFGLLNDPNGLCYFNGEHHIFYQWCPVGPVHGMKYWYHVSTKDFVHFTDHGAALHPDNDYDSHGVYSGGAWVENDKALLFFTGNKRDDAWQRESTQCMATMHSDGRIEKQGVIIENQHYTTHFRDPKVWQQDGQYFMVVGAQTLNLHGGMALYQSDDLTHWQHRGLIKTAYTEFGYMWECPDFFTLDNKAVMLFSPQGVNADDPYAFKNIFSVAYMIGDKLNIETAELENHQAIAQLDYGFDFYAPQTYLDANGRRILFAWVGLPDIDTPSVKHQWAGMLSLPREINVQDGYLVQTPLAELAKLQGEPECFSSELALSTTSFKLQFSLQNADFAIRLSNDNDDSIVFSGDKNLFSLDRSQMTQRYASEYGEVRQAPRLSLQQDITIYVDNSVIEIFCNQGKHSFTSRFFITGLNKLRISGIEQAVFFPMQAIDGI